MLSGSKLERSSKARVECKYTTSRIRLRDEARVRRYLRAVPYVDFFWPLLYLQWLNLVNNNLHVYSVYIAPGF